MTHVFTIVSCNYLAEARVLMESVAQHWPEVKRTVFVTDSPTGKFDPAGEDFAVIEATQTSLPRFRHMAFTYTPSEFCYVLKPYCAKYLFEREAADAVVYIDADMLLFRRPVELERALEQSAIILAPHRLQAELTKALHITQMKGGTFNAGLFGVRNSAQGADFLTWWGTQLTVPENIEMDWHNDQSWLNLVPGYFSETGILRHPGYDVAFWNLCERRVTRAAPASRGMRHTGKDSMHTEDGGGRRTRNSDQMSGDRGQETALQLGLRLGEPYGSERELTGRRDWRVGFGGEEYPLVLFHFSLYDPQHPDRLTGETDWARLGDDRTLEPLLIDYAAKLNAAAFEECHRWPYGHGAFRDGKIITKEHREFFKKRLFYGLSEDRNPFDPAMEPRGLGSLCNVGHPVARFVRLVRRTCKSGKVRK
jgi:hypothetical protein